jgi:hypothetical protein
MEPRRLTEVVAALDQGYGRLTQLGSKGVNDGLCLEHVSECWNGW